MPTKQTRPLKKLPANIGILLLSVILVCLPHLLRLPLWISTLCLSLIGLRYFHETGRIGLPGKFLRLLILLASIAGLFASYSTLIGRTAGSAMLLLMLCLKLMEIKGTRDVIVIIYISFFILITSFLFDQSIYNGAYILVVVLSLVTTMIIYNHPTAQQKSVSQALRQSIKQAFILLVQAVPLMLMLFFLFPRLPGPLWSLPDDGQGASTGLTDELEPGRISKLSNNPDVAFRVKFEKTPPSPERLYWRGPVLSLFTGKKWQVLKEDSVSRLNLDDINFSLPVDYTVTLEPHNRHWLFALEMPATIPARTLLTEDMQLLQTHPVRSVTRYKMRAYLNYQLDPNSIVNSYYYLQVPAQTAPATRHFVKQLRKKHSPDAAYINAVLNYFRTENFIYTRKPPLLDKDIVDQFLFETQQGYCVHYASAFAVMMRLANIPARIVSGYQGGEMNPLADYMIIRQSDAHAWVEVWLPGKGWRRIDPTSVIPDSRVEAMEDRLRRQDEQTRNAFKMKQGWLSQRLRNLGYSWDRLNNGWNHWVVGYNSSRQKSLLSMFGADKLSLQDLALLLAAVFTVCLLFIALFVFRQKQNKLDPIEQAYVQFCKKLATLGFTRKPEESALHYAHRVSVLRQDLRLKVFAVTRLYNHLRYAKHPSPRVFPHFLNKIKRFHPHKIKEKPAIK
ncbi:FIG001454: Transglutaminase-like enzymes, putative cysteine proteases [hydrothermal vent metagenome]|uniref:FIG001454: Transglutaminase-like enzymes, putative cysteine proteases n=1 Tax=hydrothermal vent metagenome TaxID=652676 RepID=A0A3B1AWP4_9ZZZZ